MGAAEQYCREVTNAFGLVAVYLPGTSLKIGDIIKYDKESLFSNKEGVFTKISTLNAMHVECDVVVDETVADLTYSSKGKTEIVTSISAEKIAKTEVKFKADGSVYMNALSCKTSSIENLGEMEAKLKENWNLKYDNLYVVTKLVTAQKAIIMQSSGKDGGLVFEMLKVPEVPIDKAELKVTRSQNQAFIVDAKDNVTVLMNLYQVKIKKQRPVTNRVSKQYDEPKSGLGGHRALRARVSREDTPSRNRFPKASITIKEVDSKSFYL